MRMVEVLSVWAMDRQSQRLDRRKMDAAGRCLGSCPHGCPLIRVWPVWNCLHPRLHMHRKYLFQRFDAKLVVSCYYCKISFRPRLHSQSKEIFLRTNFRFIQGPQHLRRLNSKFTLFEYCNENNNSFDFIVNDYLFCISFLFMMMSNNHEFWKIVIVMNFENYNTNFETISHDFCSRRFLLLQHMKKRNLSRNSLPYFSIH